MGKKVAPQVAHGFLGQVHEGNDLQIRGDELHGENTEDQQHVQTDFANVERAKLHEFVD